MFQVKIESYTGLVQNEGKCWPFFN